MLTKLTLDNFQCHKHLDIAFDQITTIIGPSDSGKSAIIRSLSWLLYNKGSLGSLIKRGEKGVTVTAEIDDHTIIRSSNNNSYALDGKVFKSIGKKVPDDIINIFRMGEDNLQTQHDYLYWFTSSGSDLISKLNKIVDLSTLDEWVSTGSKLTNGYKKTEDNLTVLYGDILDNEDNLSPYLKADKEYKEIEVFGKRLSETYGKFDSLSALVSDYEQSVKDEEEYTLYYNELKSLVENDLDGWANDFDVAYHCSDVIEQVEEIDEKIVGIDSLLSFGVDGEELLKLQKKQGDIISCLAVLSKEIPDPEPLASFAGKMAITVNRSTCLNALLGKVRDVEKEIEHNAVSYSELVSEFEEKLDGRCPMCGGEMSTDGCKEGC